MTVQFLPFRPGKQFALPPAEQRTGRSPKQRPNDFRDALSYFTGIH